LLLGGLLALTTASPARAEFPEIEVRNSTGTNLGSSSTSLFGNVAVGSSSTRSFTVKNIGFAVLYISAVSMGGLNRTNFSTSLTTGSIGIGATQTFSVTFSPSKSGPLLAGLTITNDDFNEGTFVMNFTGVGAAPEIDVSASLAGSLESGVSTVSFGNVNRGGTANRRFLIRNTGNAALQISSVSVQGGTFALDNSPTGSIPAGGSAGFNVSFSPSAAANYNGSLQIYSNDSTESLFLVGLSGNGVVPYISIEQPAGNVLADEGDPADFGDAVIGRAQSLDFVIRNVSGASLTGISLTLDGTHAAEFAAGPLLSDTLAAGASMTFPVVFTAGAEGIREASFHLSSDQSGANPIDIALTGNGTYGGDGGDPDSDGVPNLIEYATGGDPLTPDAVPGVLSGGAGSLAFTYRRKSAVLSELSLDVEWSESLSGPWTVMEPSTILLLSDDGEFQEMQAPLPPATGGSQFVRLRATRL
jgi:hypothetical protein